MPPRASRRAARLLAAALVLLAVPTVRAETLDRIVLQVNDEILTQREFDARLEAQRQAIERATNASAEDRQRALDRLPREVLREAFEELLISARAEQLKINVSEAEVAASIDEIREANKLASTDELRRAVEQEGGMSWEAFREQMRRNIRYREMMSREVASRIKLEEEDLRIYYRDNPEQFRVNEERKLREIVVLDASSLTTEQKSALAQDIRRRILAKEDPAQVVAKTAEEGKTSGVIELDWVPKGDLDPNLEAAVASLKPGEAGEPVQGRGGLHILQLLERKEATLKPFDSVKDEIGDRERQRLFTKEYPKYLKELEEKSYIVANPPPGAESFRRADASEGPDPLDVFRKKVDAAEKAAKPPAGQGAAAPQPPAGKP